MFGQNGSNYQPNQQNTQIPYEVYETVHEPAARRRRWFIRLGAALLVVTVLIAGFVSFEKAFFNKDSNTAQNGPGQVQNQGAGNGGGTGGNGQSGQQGSATPAQAVVQAPQQNAPVAETGAAAKTQSSSGQNAATVRKPE